MLAREFSFLIPESERFQNLYEILYGRYRMNISGTNDCCSYFARIIQFAVSRKNRRKLILGILVENFCCILCRRLIHPHIEIALESERKTATGTIKMVR